MSTEPEIDEPERTASSTGGSLSSGLVRLLLIVWTIPNTLIGIGVGLLGILSGGGVQLKSGCLEFYGGLITKVLKRNRIAAMTLGHTIIGLSSHELGIVRKHEQVHVRQYERWGPFFIPAYLLCSAYLIMRGKEYYRNNPFEVEAYEVDDPANKRRDIRNNDASG